MGSFSTRRKLPASYEPNRALVHTRDKLSIVKDTIDMFYHDVEPSLAAEAASKIVPHANSRFSMPTKHAGWKPFPCAFVITTQDHAAQPDRYQYASGSSDREPCL